MIQTILNRPTRSIITDSIAITTQENTDIVTDPDQIKSHIRKHFEQWTSKCRIPTLPDKWKNRYQPKKDINPIWYKETTTPITLEELLNTINKTTNNKAPGPSTITYDSIKHLEKNTKILITKIFNKVLNTGIAPTEWKSGTIYPIPKLKE